MAETANLERRSLLKIIRLVAGVLGSVGFFYAVSLVYEHKVLQAGAVMVVVFAFWYKVEIWITSL
jgi:hypothetical protein